MMWRKVAAVGTVTLSGLLFVSMMVIGFLMFVDGGLWNPPVTYETTTFQTDKTEYEAGGLVTVYLDLYKARDLRGKVTWSLVNGRIYPYATRCLTSPSGTYEKWFPLSNELLPTSNLGPPDTLYHFEGLVEYRVNPLRVVSYKLKTTPFKIIHGDNFEGPQGEKGEKGDRGIKGDKGVKGDEGDPG